MTINERIAMLLDMNHLTRTAAAKGLRVTSQYISKLVTTDAVPSDRLIDDICEYFGVRHEWLVDGEEPMREPQTVKEAVAKLAAKVYHEPNGSFKGRVLTYLANMGEEEWDVLENMITKLADEIKKDQP